MTRQCMRKWVGRLAVLTGLVVLATAVNVASPVLAEAPARPVAATTGAASLFGIDDGGVLASNETARNLAAGTGANWERISLYWSSLEPTKGVYDFASADGVIPPLLAAGFSPIVYLAMNPAWASNTTCGPVNDVQAFADMLGVLAARYPDVKVWAIYNEVDFDYADLSLNTGGCFGSSTKGGVNNNGVEDYIEYAQMLRAAWKAVHTANPSAKFASGAVAYDFFNKSAPKGYPGGGERGWFNYQFLPKLFEYMKDNPPLHGDKYMDMLLFNFYNIYGPFWETQVPGRSIQAKTNVLRKLMKDSGIEVVPLFVTETGEHSIKDWVGMKGQARCLNMTMVRGAVAKLDGIVWWTFRDFPDSAPHPRNRWKYGIVDQDLKPKPSYTALKTIVTELNGLDYAKTTSNKSGFKGVEAYNFAGSGMQKYVIWAYSKPTNPPESWKPECSWPRYTNRATFKAKTLRVVNYLNKVKNIKDNSTLDLNPAVGSITIKVGADPLIVQINP